jgi:hypothetical protein
MDVAFELRTVCRAMNPHLPTVRARFLVPLLALTVLGLLGSNLRGRAVLDTGSFACDGAMRTSRWTNGEGKPLYIRKAALWAGMSYNGKADYDGSLYRESDGSLVVHFAWDHYANPSQPHTITQDFSPNWMELAAGDSLMLHSWCQRIAGKETEGHHVVTIWWSETP